MKKTAKALSAVLAASLFAFFSCSGILEDANLLSESEISRNIVSVSDSVSESSSLASPFGLVADTGSDNLIKLTWGCPSVGVDGWYIYLDGQRVAETTILKQIEIECSAGNHTVAVAAYKNGLRSAAEGIDVSVSGKSNTSSDPYTVNSSIAAPFGLVADTAEKNSIGLAWGCPSEMPEGWAFYINGNYVSSSSNFTRTVISVSSSGTYEAGVAAVYGSSRSEITAVSVSVTVEGSSSSSGSSESSSVSSSDLVSGAIYKITAKCSGKSLDNDGWSTTEGSNIHQWAYGDNQANQQWKLLKCSDGNWIIQNVYSGFVLDADDWGTTDGTNVIQWTNNSTANQKWTITKLDNGYYKVINVHSGLSLDVSAASEDNGANVQTWTWNGTDAQLWSFTKLDSSSSSGSSSSGSSSSYGVNGISTDTNDFSSLVSLSSGMQLTFEFQNCTNGAFADNEIYIYVICMNTSNVWCYAKPDGTLVPIGDSSSSAWQYTLADVKSSGFQMPYASAGRIYYSYGTPLTMNGISGGVVLPSLSNPSDPNYNIYFDWLEFTVASNGFWVNTTQVDQLGFPVLINVYDKDGNVQQTGISKTRESIWKAFVDEMPDEFDTLVGEYRIVAPCKAGFDNRNGGAYGSYFDSYVTETWNTIASKSQTVTHPQGKFTLTSDGTNLYFYCVEAYGTIASAGTTYTIYGKPSTSEVLEGYGVLASGNAMELALEAWICAALNRHVAHLEPDVYWNNASSYYNAGPCNYYAKFWHDHSERGGLAYGFCYDDVNDQSATTYTGNARGVVVRLGF